jgi:hypothetical protein
MSTAGTAETRRAGAVRLSAADAQVVVLHGRHKEAAE